jgi:ATP/maltotriose-dependent transcriptional regulator MalT
VTFEREAYSEARSYYEQSLVLARRFGFQAITCMVLNNMGEIACRCQNDAQAESYFKEGLAIAREIEYREILELLQNLGELTTKQGKYEQAAAYYQEGMHLAHQWEYPAGVRMMLYGLAAVALAQENQALAETYFQESLTAADHMNDFEMLVPAYCKWGELYLSHSQLDLAAVAFKQVLKLAYKLNRPVEQALGKFGLARIAAVQGDLAAAQLEAAACLKVLELTGHPKAANVRQWLALLA